MRVGRTAIDDDEAWLLLHVYRQEAVIYYDFDGSLSNTSPRPDDMVTLRDFGRILGLGVSLDPAMVSKAFTAAASANWHDVPQSLCLNDANPKADPELLASVTHLYNHFRYRHGLGAAPALAILHLRRPNLVPLFTDSLFAFYSHIASDISAEFGRSTPMFWEAVRRDLVENSGALQKLRARLENESDGYSSSLSLLSDVRLHCIVAQQLVDASGR